MFLTSVFLFAEYDISSIQQMAGRAGRPGFDSEGKVIILTQEEKVHRYRDILSRTIMLESRLPENLVEHLNSEIVLKSIKDVESMLSWAASTFFSVRAKISPKQYFPSLAGKGGEHSSLIIDRHIRELMMQVMRRMVPALFMH